MHFIELQLKMTFKRSHVNSSTKIEEKQLEWQVEYTFIASVANSEIVCLTFKAEILSIHKPNIFCVYI